ncbi:2-oxoacid:acceptor oxidoreductase subunit alpha [Candidatus Woesearchaeota archaeon]|nr:2-oxoacid:acceptor oxidoreductase subunit alpha [Candidatus Woesearchaeota archaeon]
MAEINKLVWKIGGEAGYGIMTTGLMFSKACLRGNLHIFDSTEYPSLIRGGHNNYTARVEDKEIHTTIQIVNILAALNKETIDLHLQQLTKKGVVIYDHDDFPIDKTKLRNDVSYLHVPLLRIVRDLKAERVMRNNILLGASFAVVSYDFKIIESIIKDFFKSKGEEVINQNIALAKAGYDYITANYKEVVQDFPNKLKKIGENKEHILLTGNDACSLGALASGCKFVSIYPMTPISEILSSMERYEKQFNIVVKQPEDEISAVNMAIGAWHAGTRALTATSGGGFCLMTEGLGLAAMTETPLVVINGMRGGPSTGLPTWTEQGDLHFILNAAHGEFPRIVIAPGDVDDAYNLMIDAFNLAEKYQLVVLFLTDKHLNESHKSTKKFNFDAVKIERGKFLTDKQLQKMAAANQEYKRFAFVDDGVSPRVMPGQKHGLFIASSDEHNESGFFNEEADNRIKMMQKRFKKLETAMKDIPQPKLVGDQNAEFTFISFGSTKGAILEAMQFLADKKIKANFMQLKYLNPFPTESVINLIKNSKNVICIECNLTGQLAALIREKTGIEIKNNLRKYDGRPFYPEEIHDYVINLFRVRSAHSGKD